METALERTDQVASRQDLTRNMVLATPFMMLVPVAFASAFMLGGTDLRWTAVAAGAAGWLAALMLRVPVGLLLIRALGSPERTTPWVVGSSGPLEEGMRLVALALIGRSFDEAVSIGLGWAAIEVLYTVGTGVATLSLLRRDDLEALQAQQMLAAQGMLRTTGPALGVLERTGATALHVGFTMIVAWSGIAAIATAIVHSLTNLTLVRTFRTSPLVTELALLAVGFTSLAAGIALLG